MCRLIIVLAAVMTVSAAANRDRYVFPVKTRIEVYENRIRELYEQPLYTVGSDDRFLVLAEEGRFVHVKDLRDRTGWIEKRLVTSVSPSVRMQFDDAVVRGDLDYPVLFHVWVGPDADPTPLRLDRSFREELAVNVDRETIERIAR